MMNNRHWQEKYNPILIIINILILGTILAGCTLNFKALPPGNPDQVEPNELATAPADVQFILEIPPDLSDGERIVLEVLDEVTGLPYNGRQYDLTALDDRRYGTTLTFPTGSVVKYRYLKVSNTFIGEATLASEPVRYRLLVVHDEQIVQDQLQQWQGETRTANTGTLSGSLTDAATGAPLADILVSVAGSLTFTDANGKFELADLSVGIHNVVFYAMDGKFDTFQQGATIATGMTTPVSVQLNPRAAVKVTFQVTAPNDALGVPIYMAGNLSQLGNTFTDLTGGMNIKPKQMPLLTQQDDGSFELTLTLFAGTDLRYKFTLGDGYWNAEQAAEEGGFRTRQLIVPDHDVVLEQTIHAWRTPGFEPVTFEISTPQGSALTDEKYIQLKAREWTEPLPLWPLGDEQYLFIVFSPFNASIPLSYRFCRNENCAHARNLEALSEEWQLQPITTAQTVNLTLNAWENWQPITEPTEVAAAVIQAKPERYLTEVALTPEMDPAWAVYAPLGLDTLSEIDANAVLFSPQWFTTRGSKRIAPNLGRTPFTKDLARLAASAQASGLSVGLFPQIGPTQALSARWNPETTTPAWWMDWFASYRRFALNYAATASQIGAERLILGGKAVLPAFSGSIFPDGSATNAPEELDDLWRQLIADIRVNYGGSLVWATNAQVSADPLPTFIDQFDAIYATVDAPLAENQSADLPTLADAFSAVLETQITPIHQDTGLPVTVALGYPSVTSASAGCTLLDDICSNDGLFLPEETSSLAIDLDAQVRIYNAVFPKIAEQDWVSGVSVIGYNPIVSLMDGSSSIAGKPASDVVWYWYAGFHPSP
ncbi:MAG: hypothetical protein SVR81_04085 [Chloroflexota bacterium]|nr:hypothetical protein [Chloroflexota bacterium]